MVSLQTGADPRMHINKDKAMQRSIGFLVAGWLLAAWTVSAQAQWSVPPAPAATMQYSASPTGSVGYGGNGYSMGYGGPSASAYGYQSGYTATGAGPGAGVGPFWAPGGYEARIGSPYLYHDPNGGQFVVTGNPYYDHFGPGFHRQSLHGHYRFPYYNYRAPWYYPGRAVYNRDTNLHW